jgi:hypothetical protein
MFMGDDSKTKIIGWGRVRLTLQDGRSRALPGVLHIPGLERNLISVTKMSDAGVHLYFRRIFCKMVKGLMILMKGFWIGTLYKLLGKVNSTGCNNIIVPKVDSTRNRLEFTQLGMSRFKPTQKVIVNSTRPCYGMRGWDILKEKDFKLCITKAWSKIFLNVI